MKLKDRTIKVEIEVCVLSARVRRRRMVEALTQKELGDKVGLSRVQIANIESGKHMTSLDTLMNLCDVFGCTPNDLLL